MITQKLIAIQTKLKAPKNQRNNFGKYNYRSCEDILEAVKPHLLTEDVSIMVTDTIKEVAGIPYVEARAVFFDDTKDADSTNTHGKDKKWLNVNTPEFNKAKDFIKGGGSLEQIEAKYKLAKETKELLIK